VPEDTKLEVALTADPKTTWHCHAKLLRQTQKSPDHWEVVVFWTTGGDTERWKQWITHYTG
jgi:hypothetical protein